MKNLEINFKTSSTEKTTFKKNSASPMQNSVRKKRTPFSNNIATNNSTNASPTSTRHSIPLKKKKEHSKGSSIKNRGKTEDYNSSYNYYKSKFKISACNISQNKKEIKDSAATSLKTMNKSSSSGKK